MGAAFIMIFYAVGPGGTIYTFHRRMGIAAMSLGLTQVGSTTKFAPRLR